MNIETISIHDWKKYWLEKPYMDTNELFLEWQFCSMNHKMMRARNEVEGIRILKNLDKMCHEFSEWQEYMYKSFKVSELAECIGDVAFRVYIATRDKSPFMHRIWKALRWNKEHEDARDSEYDSIYFTGAEK